MQVGAYIIAHNCSGWIEQSVRSLLDWGLVRLVAVVEGAERIASRTTPRGLSTDGTTAILERLAGEFPDRLVYLPMGRGTKVKLRNAALDLLDRSGHKFAWLMQWGDDEVFPRESGRALQRFLDRRRRVTSVRFKHWIFCLDPWHLRDWKHRSLIGPLTEPAEIFPLRIWKFMRGLRHRGDQNALPFQGTQTVFAKAQIFHGGYIGEPEHLVQRCMWHMRNRARIYGWPNWDERRARQAAIVNLLVMGPHRIGQFMRPWPTGLQHPQRFTQSPEYKRLEERDWSGLLEEIDGIPWNTHWVEVYPGLDVWNPGGSVAHKRAY